MPALFVLAAALLLAAPVHATDPLSEARRLYNQGQFEAAERAARDAVRTPATADGGRLVLGRVQLERYRTSASASDLSDAIDSLRAVDARPLEPRERVELTIGLAEALYLEDRFGAAVPLFELALDSSSTLGPLAHERVLDWWGSALDHEAERRPPGERTSLYERLRARMTAEIVKDPGSIPAGYWVAAAARGTGDLEGALNEATAGWLRAVLSRDRGAALRGDLDRLVLEGILPDRALRLAVRDHAQALAGMVAEWEAFKAKWAQ
jgi:tetratricopeptide (TPR) repeat protein